MARAPAAAAPSGMMTDPTGGAGMDPGMDDGSGADMDAGTGDKVVCTITQASDGTYTVYAGDEPDPEDAGGMSGDDADAMGAAGAAPAPGGGAPMGGGMGGGAATGQPADSIGMATKLVVDVLKEAASTAGGTPGSADDQFAAGFGASKSPTPSSGMKQKY